jgi:SAM-dependent methyltransferase
MQLIRAVKHVVFAKRSPLRPLQRLLYRITPYRSKFITYYREWGWGPSESVSGPGSTLAATRFVRLGLQDVFQKFGVRTFMDVPCGDFHWMRDVDLSGIEYLGIDIVPDLILDNIRKFGLERVRFQCADMLKDRLPAVDLILCRDCLFHYPNKPILRAVRNLKESGSCYLLTTTHPDLERNRELGTAGRFRPVNLQKPPFSFPEPLFMLDEREGQGKWLGLWRLSDLLKPSLPADARHSVVPGPAARAAYQPGLSLTGRR